MASIIPYSLGEDMANADVLFDGSHSFKIMLLGTNAAALNKTFSKRSDLTTYEVSGTGYTAGGEDISITRITRSTGTTSVAWTARTTWASADGFVNRYAAIYRVVGGAASGDFLVCIIDPGTNATANGLDFAFDVTSALTIVAP